MNQKYLKTGGLMVLVMIASATPQLATDMYLPALPVIARELGTTQAIAGLTMTLFFLFLAIGMLTVGQISDQIGRKKTLLACSVIGLACAALAINVQSIEPLIALRCIHGFAAGGTVALGNVLIRDCFEGKKLTNMLSIAQSIGMVAPMVAPIIGGFLTEHVSWRAIFMLIAILTAITLVLTLLFQETLRPETRATGGVRGFATSMGGFLRDRRFVSIMLLGGLFNTPFMIFLGLSSFIYVDIFHLSETAFSLYFAILSIFGVLGPLFYMHLANLNEKRFITILLIVYAVFSVLMLAFGHAGPIPLLICCIPFMAISSLCRSMYANIVLRSCTKDFGAASSLITFATSFVATIGMAVTGVFTADSIMSLSVGILVCVVLIAIVWVQLVGYLNKSGREL